MTRLLCVRGRVIGLLSGIVSITPQLIVRIRFLYAPGCVKHLECSSKWTLFFLNSIEAATAYATSSASTTMQNCGPLFGPGAGLTNWNARKEGLGRWRFGHGASTLSSGRHPDVSRPPGLTVADITLSTAHVRLAVGSIHGLARAEGRTVTRPEQGAITALLRLVQEPPGRPKRAVIKPKVRQKRPAHPTGAEIEDILDRLPIGGPVRFRSAGRDGLSPPRSGTVVAYHESTRGVWIVVAEEGAAPGVVVRTRASLVSSA